MSKLSTSTKAARTEAPADLKKRTVPPRLRLNLVIVGEPVGWVAKWRMRGLVGSARDLVLQALRALYDKTLETDLKALQVGSENGGNHDE